MGAISANLVDRLGSLPAPVSPGELDDPSALGEALDAVGYLGGGNVYDPTAVSEATARLKADCASTVTTSWIPRSSCTSSRS